MRLLAFVAVAVASVWALHVGGLPGIIARLRRNHTKPRIPRASRLAGSIEKAP